MPVVKRCLNGLIGLLLTSAALQAATEPLDDEFLQAQPRVQLYMAYAEFKMANYRAAEAMWRAIKGPARAEAAFNLGILYEQGLGVDADMAQAVQFYRQGATAGSRSAAYQLGLIRLNHPQYRDLKLAERWLSMAALDGDDDAKQLLLEMKSDDASSDPLIEVRRRLARGESEQAVALLQQLSRQNPPLVRAITRLGWLYEAGIGVERDLQQAAKLFRQAAQAGDAEAQYALAVMLQTGVGQPQDFEQARLWLQRAAKQNYPQAKQQLEAQH